LHEGEENVARLVISRRAGESFKIGDDVTVTLVEFHGNQARFVWFSCSSAKWMGILVPLRLYF
jgi:hypothetical protein